MTNDVPRQNKRQRLRYSTWTLAWVWLFFLAISLLMIGMIVAVRTGETQQQVVQQNIDRSLALALSHYRNDVTYSQFLLNDLLGDQTFLEEVKSSDPNLLHTLQIRPSLVKSTVFVGVWDKAQHLLAQSGTNNALGYTPQMLQQDLQTALRGESINQIEVGAAGLARNVVVAPIREPGAAQPFGALVIGFYLDDVFSDPALQLNTKQELVVVSEGRYVMTSLSALDGTLFQGQPAPEIVQVAQAERDETPFFELDTQQGNFVFKFVPLSMTPDSTGMLGIGVPAMTPLDAMSAFWGDYGLPFSLLFLVMGTIGLVYLYGVRNSFRELRTSMQPLRGGDYATPITVVRGDEIGDVASDLERVRERFAADMTAALTAQQTSAQIIEAMRVAVIVTEPNQHIALVNAAAENFLGETRAQLMGESWVALFNGEGNGNPNSFAWQVRQDQADVATQHAIAITTRTSLRKNPLLKVDIISSPIVMANQIRGFVHVLTDPSLHERDLRAKDEFLLNASHELRSPLAKLRAASELVLEAYDEKNWSQTGALLANMQRTINRFQIFVENLIDIGSIQAGRFYVRPRRIDYNRVVADALVEFQPSTALRSQAVEFSSTIPSPCYVMGDPQRLIQVLFNLLTNALKYGGEDSPIQVSVYVKNASVYTEVIDRGPGIPAEEIPQIFQRYYRGKSVELEGMGIGVGLAIAREIMEQHGGEINAKSDKMDGTCFWFRLPLTDIN